MQAEPQQQPQPHPQPSYRQVRCVPLHEVVQRIVDLPEVDPPRSYWSWSFDGTKIPLAEIKRNIVTEVRRLEDNRVSTKLSVMSRLLNTADIADLIRPLIRELLLADVFVVATQDQASCIAEASARLRHTEYFIRILAVGDSLLLLTNFAGLLVSEVSTSARYSERIRLRTLHPGTGPLPSTYLDMLVTQLEAVYDTYPHRYSYDLDRIATVLKTTIVGMEDLIQRDNVPTETTACCVCYGPNVLRVALTPCGHTQTCRRCVSQLEGRCPICKTQVQGTMNVFL